MKLAENDGEVQVLGGTETSEEQTLGATPDDGTEGAQADGTTDQDDETEIVVTIGEEAPPSEEDEDDSPDLVNKLRKLNREKDRELRELRKARPAAPVTSEAPAAAPAPRPTLAECDYDEDDYATKLTAWHEQQAQVKAAEQKKADAAKAEQDAWNAKLAAYNKQKTSLKVANYEDAEDAVRTAFSQVQQSILIDAADNAAHVVAALGNNPAQLKALASITSPMKFAYALAKLETQLKVKPRKAPPPPEQVVRGSAPVSAGKGDAQLAKLEAEAERTGDRSRVVAFKREQRRAQS